MILPCWGKYKFRCWFIRLNYYSTRYYAIVGNFFASCTIFLLWETKLNIFLWIDIVSAHRTHRTQNTANVKRDIERIRTLTNQTRKIREQLQVIIITIFYEANNIMSLATSDLLPTALALYHYFAYPSCNSISLLPLRFLSYL